MKSPGTSAHELESCDLTEIMVVGSVVSGVAALQLHSLLH